MSDQTEKKKGGLYSNAYGERRRKRHRKGQSRINLLLGLFVVSVIAWFVIPNPTEPPPSSMEDRTRSYPANGTNSGVAELSTSSEANTPLPEDIAPNPLLEVYIDKTLRAGPFQFEIGFPKNEAALVEQADGTHLFRLSGTVITEEEPFETRFRVHLFSNKAEDYERFQPIFTEDLIFQTEGDHYVFQLSRPAELGQGLYYYLIEEGETSEVFFVGKVTVE